MNNAPKTAEILDFEVKIPEIPGKIGRFTKGGTTYVRYVAGRIYHPDRKYNIPNHKTIGKLSPTEPSMMIPNENFSKPATHTYGTATVIPNPIKTVDEDVYTFMGWNVNGGGGLIKDLTLPATSYNSNITLKANWRKATEVSILWRIRNGELPQRN